MPDLAVFSYIGACTELQTKEHFLISCHKYKDTVIRIKILIMGHFLLTFRISMGHSFTFFVNISDFNGTFSDGM